MTEAVLAHAWLVPAAPERIYDLLTDPTSYVGLTPFVIAVEDVRPSAGGHCYNAVEQFRIGRVPAWKNRIAVTMRGDRDALTVRQDVVSPGRVRLWSVIELAPADAGTTVSETITVRMPRPLAGFVRRQARAAQVYRAAEITRRLAPAEPHPRASPSR